MNHAGLYRIVPEVGRLLWEVSVEVGNQAPQRSVLIPMLRAAQSLLVPAGDLASAGQSVPALALTRAIWESCLNIGYLAVVGGDLDDRMLRHAQQKLARNLKRIVTAGSESVSLASKDADSILSEPDVVAKVAEFTRKNGSEKTQWCDADIDERIEAIRKVNPSYAAHLHLNMVLCYRGPSEILHGTLAGAMIGFGVGDLAEFRRDGPVNPQKIAASLFYQFRILTALSVSTCKRVVEILPMGGSRDKLVQRCDALWQKLRQLESADG